MKIKAGTESEKDYDVNKEVIVVSELFSSVLIVDLNKNSPLQEGAVFISYFIKTMRSNLFYQHQFLNL